ncbi:hypothetical protein EJG51_018210 [Undibacterium piscinae]|uniref:Cache 3/Cache 2 fusion domain-containing protein n=1 Tax=Undibacterium piscinae TaxID=2495591 RepID=A0A6M4A9B8_9BURK|nr:hypothetical protein EJG51_018210 [Undibacterium piscinae]
MDVVDSLKELKDKIKSIKIGETGYFFGSMRRRKDQGMLMVHPAKEASNIIDAKDLEKKNGASTELNETAADRKSDD